MSYRDTLRELADRAGDQVAAIAAAYLAGKLTADEATALIAAFITAANDRATALADLGLAASLTVATGRPVPALGLVPPADTDRLAKAAATLLAALPDTPDSSARAARLGRSEPLTRAAAARGEALAESSHVEGWTRSVSGSGCQLCTWWRRDGRVWPATHPMPTHPGCSCTQTPVLVDHVKPVTV